MTSSPPPASAGWYDDDADPTVQRYWDGKAWTTHTAPKSAVPVAGAGLSKKSKGWLIAGGVVAALILFSGVAAAAGGGHKDVTPVAIAETPKPVEAKPTPTVAPSPAPTVAAVVVDLAQFKSDSLRDLNDFNKDLGDMDVTLDEGGFWRLLSNSLELSFNLGQLEGHIPPESIAAPWATGLVGLDAAITTINNAVGASDDAATRAAIAAARDQATALIALVNGAT
jgi:hypothetical protein